MVIVLFDVDKMLALCMVVVGYMYVGDDIDVVEMCSLIITAVKTRRNNTNYIAL